MPARTTSDNCHFLTPVWGESYVRLYLDVVIPAQLSPKNLPAFGAAPGTQYVIYTTDEDRQTIESSPIFKKLNSVVAVKFDSVDLGVNVTHDRMSDCFRRGIIDANAADVAVVFLTPDIVFADGSFETMRRLAAKKRDVIFVPAIRTVKPSVAAALLAKASNGIISVSSRELMQVALDNLHPLADLSWWDEGHSELLPANLYWRVGNEGLLARCFHLHPIYVRPQRKFVEFFGTVDDDFVAAACPNPARDYVVVDSDEFLAIELSDPSHAFKTGFKKASVEHTVTWAEQFTDERHRRLFDYTVRMHVGVRDQAAWSNAARAAEIAASTIKQELKVSTLALMWRRSPRLVRRLIRYSHKKRLLVANRPQKRVLSVTGSIKDFVDQWPILLLDSYRRAINLIVSLRKSLLGARSKPRFFTSRYLFQRILRPDLVEMAGSLGECTFIGDDPVGSHMRTILSLRNPGFGTASLSKVNDEYCFVSRETNRVLGADSFDTVLLDIDDRKNVEKCLTAAFRILRADGKILLLFRKLMPKPDAWPPFSRPAMEGLMSPDYVIVDHRTQGGYGSALKIRMGSVILSLLRGHRIVARLLELMLIWIPVYMFAGAALNVAAILTDRLLGSRGSAVSSLTLARKRPMDPEQRS